MKKLTILLILITLTGCTQVRNYRAKRLIDKAKQKIEKAEKLKPGISQTDTVRTTETVAVPVTIPGDTTESIFTNTAMKDTIHKVDTERGTVLVEIDYPDYAKDFITATESLPDLIREPVRKTFRDVIASDIRYKVVSEIPAIDTTLRVEVEKETIATIAFKEREVEKTPARNKWLIGLLIGILAAFFAMVFMFLRKKRQKE
jgi:hypothetical protein